jgi:Phage terminase large subunit (GpA)
MARRPGQDGPPPPAARALAAPSAWLRILGRELRTARAAQARERAQAQNSLPDFLTWSRAIPTTRGAALDFERFPFQPEIYRAFGNPQVKEAVVMKSTQVGASELLARLTLYFADLFGETTLYVFPALTQLRDFSDSRVDKLLETSPYLRRRAGRPWNKRLKRIGGGECYYRGSQSKNDLIAVSAGLLVLDEYDSLVAEHIPEAEQRVAGSELALIRRVGVPSDPEYGIAKLYEQSDQRGWHVECGACGESQPLTFEDNLRWSEDQGRISNPRLVCRQCAEALDVRRGAWTAKYPERTMPGFHVHRLMVRNANLVQLIEASKKKAPHLVKSFYNSGLGLPYTEESGSLDRTAIAAAISAGHSYTGGPMLIEPAYNGTNIVTAGIDIASARALHVRVSEHVDPLTTVGGRKRALLVGTVNSFEELARLLDRYQVRFAVIDAAPEGRLALGLAESYPGRVYVARYSSTLTEPLELNTERRLVSARRDIAIDATIASMRSLRNLLPEDLPDDYVEHMIAVRRKIAKDRYDRQIVTYESNGEDDYFHAEVYDLLATEVARIRLEMERVIELEGTLIPLDELVEFPRSKVDDPDSMEYHPGPGGFDYYY